MIETSHDERCEDPEHRSYSGDRTWDQCQFLAEAERTGRTERKWGMKVAVGSAVDKAVRLDILYGGGETPSDEDLLVQFASKYDVGFTTAEWDKAVEKTAALHQLARDEVIPSWEAVGIYAVDWELHFPIGDITYHCHLDVALQNGTVVDLKTSEDRLDRSGSGRVEVDPQLSTYALAFRTLWGRHDIPVRLDGLIYANQPDDVQPDKKLKRKPWWDRQIGVRTDAQLDAFEATLRRREAGRRFARTTGLLQTQGISSQYACNSCGAKAICPAWAGWWN